MSATALADDAEIESLLGPGPVRQVRLDFTTRCNLRCVYCAVSQPSYVGADMPTDLAVRAAELVAEPGRYHKIHTIGVNGHGESTYPANWTGMVAPLLHRRLPLSITTNLGKVYAPAEIQVLAQFRNIAISLDTADAALLRRVRRKVDLARITSNIACIRRQAARLERRPPNFAIVAGLFYPCALTVAGLAEWAVQHGIRRVGFWDLRRYDYDAIDLPAPDRPVPLAELEAATLQSCLDALSEARRMLAAHGIAVSINANFVAVLARRRGLRFA